MAGNIFKVCVEYDNWLNLSVYCIRARNYIGTTITYGEWISIMV